MTKVIKTEKILPVVPVIEEFLQQWKQRAFTFYSPYYTKHQFLESQHNDSHKELNQAQEKLETPLKEEIRTMMTELDKMEVNDESTAYWEEIKAKQENAKRVMTPYFDRYKSTMNDMQEFIKESQGLIIWNSKISLDQALDREVLSKKKTLFARLEKKAGNVLDADLNIGVNGEINGTITGDKSTVKIETIYAGGHNIQCLHYRVLVK